MSSFILGVISIFSGSHKAECVVVAQCVDILLFPND